MRSPARPSDWIDLEVGLSGPSGPGQVFQISYLAVDANGQRVNDPKTIITAEPTQITLGYGARSFRFHYRARDHSAIKQSYRVSVTVKTPTSNQIASGTGEIIP